VAPILTPQASDFPQWYQDVVAKAELAEGGPVRGTMVIRPYGYAIWERMQAELDARIKAAGVANAYFPLFIPESYFRREAEHVEGFSPELAVVTHAGGKELDEPVVVRPTSETIIDSFLAKWVQSYRDLPFMVNQWANVVRWELRPRLFLRGTEFLWQEGHTAHATQEDAHRFALQVLKEIYADFMVNVLAVPVLLGRKTDLERFAGAITTWTAEAMMRDGKALQMGTSHELGQGFAEAFGISFLDPCGAQRYCWQTSWGASTRLMGALVMAHGDDNGLRLPPAVAPVQVAVLAVRPEGGASEAAERIAQELRAGGARAVVDTRADLSWGRRVVAWELRGAPARVEVGPKELAEGNVVLARRDLGTKEVVPLGGVVAEVTKALEAAQSELLAGAQHFVEEHTADAASLDEAGQVARDGFARLPAKLLSDGGEAKLNGAGITVRLLQRPDGSLPAPDEPLEDLVAVVGRAY
jgi:prolyl-tRNA synthetase